MIGAIIMCITIEMEGGCENKRELKDSSRKQDKWGLSHTWGFVSTRDIRMFYYLTKIQTVHLSLTLGYDYPLCKQ